MPIEKKSRLQQTFETIDNKIILWMRCHSHRYLRYSLGLIFIWFGLLKPFNLSPANELVAHTVYWFDPSWFVPFLGWWEVIIGLCLIYKPLLRLGIFLMALQMIGTFMPLVLLPDIVYGPAPFSLTLEGQYIIKNIVVIAAAITIGGHVRDKSC